VSPLAGLVADELAIPVRPEVAHLAAAVAARHGGAARSVLFYGSCLRAAALDGLMLDFYLIVSDYAAAFDKRWLAAAMHSGYGAIRTHMFARDPVGPEAIYLHDADALDWLGAIGVARSFGLVDPKGGDPDGPKAVQDLQHSLETVPPRIVSKAGKALTPQRVRELEQFLQELRAESGNLKSL